MLRSIREGILGDNFVLLDPARGIREVSPEFGCKRPPMKVADGHKVWNGGGRGSVRSRARAPQGGQLSASAQPRGAVQAVHSGVCIPASACPHANLSTCQHANICQHVKTPSRVRMKEEDDGGLGVIMTNPFRLIESGGVTLPVMTGTIPPL